MLRQGLMFAAGVLLIAAPAAAQKKPAPRPAPKPVVQKVIPPKAVYWLSAATTSGFGLSGLGTGSAPSTADMMRMAMGGGGGSSVMKTLSLDLGTKLPATPPPHAAQHLIPAGMGMGPSLALKTPKAEPATPGREPEDFERPKGRVLIFWGCGESAPAGQPVVIDFAAMAAGQMPPNLFAGERVRITRPPSPGSWPSYGNWPNDDPPSKRGVPATASLIGDHKITGNYTPDIDFTLDQDFMGALTLKQAKLPSGAVGMTWNALPRATAHFAQLIGGQGEGKAGQGATMVFWSSSATQTFISALGDYVAPAEAARLVERQALMPPTQTSCTIPKEVLAAAPEGALVSLVAHGPEENFIHPPRPADPRVPWDQSWAVKARFVARTGGIAGMDMAAMMGGGSADARGRPRKPKCPVDMKAEAGKAAANAMLGGLGGLLGSRKKKPQEDCEP